MLHLHLLWTSDRHLAPWHGCVIFSANATIIEHLALKSLRRKGKPVAHNSHRILSIFGALLGSATAGM
jgi:hypothetical protein